MSRTSGPAAAMDPHCRRRGIRSLRHANTNRDFTASLMRNRPLLGITNSISPKSMKQTARRRRLSITGSAPEVPLRGRDIGVSDYTIEQMKRLEASEALACGLGDGRRNRYRDGLQVG